MHYYIIHYYVLLQFVITLLLHHYCILLHHSLLLIITFSVITLLLHHYYILLHTHYYLLLRHYYYALSYHYNIIITSLLLPYSQSWIAKTGNNELIITYYALSLFHYYIVITHYYHYYPLLHVTNGATCRWQSAVTLMAVPYFWPKFWVDLWSLWCLSVSCQCDFPPAWINSNSLVRVWKGPTRPSFHQLYRTAHWGRAGDRTSHKLG